MSAPVSVIIPCWHCADTIGRAVASVAAQTLRPAEVILVDDAGGDGTLAALHAMAAQYGADWVKIIALPGNQGAGAARNAGWDAATQPYLAFLDADDAWFPAKLERQWGWMQAHPDVVLTGHPTQLWQPDAPIPAVPEALSATPVTLRAMLVSNRFPTRSVMLRRDLPFRFGSRQDTEDYALWLDIVSFGAPTAVLNAVLGCCFRPDASPGGYSGQLWRHERRELFTLARLRDKGGIGGELWLLAALWSLVKYGRRVVRRWL